MGVLVKHPLQGLAAAVVAQQGQMVLAVLEVQIAPQIQP